MSCNPQQAEEIDSLSLKEREEIDSTFSAEICIIITLLELTVQDFRRS